MRIFDGGGGCMADEVLLNKAAVIERCIARVREEYAQAGAQFASDYEPVNDFV